jgi:hypothetical protein
MSSKVTDYGMLLLLDMLCFDLPIDTACFYAL